MYPTSDRFPGRLAESHQVVWQIQLFRTDGSIETVEHTGGSVSVDRSRPVRRSCTVTSADVSLIPKTPTEQLAAYGARIRIARGVEYGDGSTELVPLGVFRLDAVSGDPVLGPVTLTGSGLEAVVADDKFTAPYRASGTVVGAVTALIRRSIPAAEVVSTIADSAIGPRTWDVEGDPWTAAQEVAAAAGAEVYANADGVFTISTLPDLLTTAPSWTVAAGEGGVYLSGVRGMSGAGVYNGVLARGENAETGVAPVSYLATDNDPGSPTYWLGLFGHRPTFYSSPTLTTTGMCQAAAELLLRSAKAPNSVGDFSSLPNPALDCGDVLRVVHPDGSAELHQVASFTVPLDVGGDFPIATISAKEDS
ncbi:DUF5047 domain-containing protein [Streptomyces sp. NBC_01565]|uniref:DUF5047 domain-containing protein n=1 Tax=Streptomyces sp. NBC_01565 TaxID=2975881 RepID=UPI00225B7460|nr:DUF5047 domain-containing protein [Streptomyces sp. NBC_01565]MCX4543766.1 DUF5047 domain-containing protein [Streptomyces sp. NBC_01565]